MVYYRIVFLDVVQRHYCVDFVSFDQSPEILNGVW